ncbi:phage/plasmid primase, P4 family [Streptomyces sp. N35]|uniref:DNA primase family protein n=1 Tax=Streptomyces sp. N35 TaxID=2795730 RepID=UPI0018F484C9|nr:phage/plasmid primase, P4 family [Streptomyces sp. N35]
MTSAESTGTSRFDPTAAAQQMFDLAAAGALSGLPTQAPQEGPQPTGILPDTLTDRGNAKLFAQMFGDRFRHVEDLGWYMWDEYRWRRDGAEKAAIWAVGDMAEQMPEFDPRGISSVTAVQMHRRRSMSTAGVKALLHQAQASPALSFRADELDHDDNALCTPGGVVNLRTGELHKPDPFKSMHSRATTVAPEAQPTPRFDRFMTDTFGNDTEGAEMINFLHLLLGYSITGQVGGQVMPFLFGSGKNGKSVLLDMLMKLLGDYADAAPAGFLMARPFEGHPTDLAELHGRRVVVCSEIKPGDSFDEARVKLLTGGDRIKARRMRQDFFSFEPTHKLWLLGNHRPEVGAGGFAFWRRMRLIPFERVVSDKHRVDDLADVLVTEEGPGILNWLIEGARRYLNGEKDLNGPERVRLATQAYESTEDHIGRFLAECCMRAGTQAGSTDLKVEQGLLHRTYVKWCGAEERPASSRAFAARVRQELGLGSPKDMSRANGAKYYPGLALVDEAEQEQSAVPAARTGGSSR